MVWHDLEDERKALKKAVPEMVDIYGSMELETREQRVMDFAQGRTRIFGTKKSLSGSGCNFQRHCHRAIFMGIDYEFNDFIQAIHRIYRFLQKSPVIIDILYMDTETEVLLALQRKWRQYDVEMQKAAIDTAYLLNADTASIRRSKCIILCYVEGKTREQAAAEVGFAQAHTASRAITVGFEALAEIWEATPFCDFDESA